MSDAPPLAPSDVAPEGPFVSVSRSMRVSLTLAAALSFSAGALPGPLPQPAELRTCLAKLRSGARANGLSLADYDRFARSIQWQARTIENYGRQPESVLTWQQYLERVLPPSRVVRGQKIFAEWRAQAEKVARRYGSDAAVITAIWGVESDFGASMGTFPVLDAWATLACHKPSELRIGNFYGAMRLLAADRVPADRFIGSWSGAFGLTQFIPTSYEAYAADGDDDGKIDLYSSVPDALASTARHLAERTYWIRGLPAAIEVTMPAPLARQLTLGSDGEQRVKAPQPLSAWARQGVSLVDGTALSSLDFAPTTPLQALFIEGAQGRVFLLSGNFDALLSYNKSVKYAIAVAVLAQRVQEPPPAAAAPATSAAGPAAVSPAASGN